MIDRFKRNAIYENACNFFGFNNQVIACIEELSELNVELSKILIKKRDVNNNLDDLGKLVDELADAEIMLEQMNHNFNCRHAVRERIDFKIKRLKTNLDKYKEGE